LADSGGTFGGAAGDASMADLHMASPIVAIARLKFQQKKEKDIQQ
jgi:hypothetical protein